MMDRDYLGRDGGELAALALDIHARAQAACGG
jgi:hypothetical protein